MKAKFHQNVSFFLQNILFYAITKESALKWKIFYVFPPLPPNGIVLFEAFRLLPELGEDSARKIHCLQGFLCQTHVSIDAVQTALDLLNLFALFQFYC